MKAIIKNGVLVDSEGFTLYPNRVYEYGTAFKNILEGHPDGTEVSIGNVWDHKTLYSDDARILYGSCLNFNFVDPVKTSEETEEQSVIINDPNITFDKGRDNDGDTGDNISSESNGVSDSELHSSVQNESDNVEGV